MRRANPTVEFAPHAADTHGPPPMSISALYTSSTGVQAGSAYLDVVANNLANVNTTAYKTQQVSFADLLYTLLPGGAPGAAATSPGPDQVGSGVTVSAVTGLFTQGALNPTSQPYDLAISGEGFFNVLLPDGSVGFTRAGNFAVDANGTLVSVDGFPLADGIVIPPGVDQVTIGADGTVTAATPDGLVTLGQITLTQFVNPAGLLRVGDNTFAASPSSGAAVTGVPGTGSLGTLNQGFLEQSNVEPVNELVNLIVAQQTFTFNTRAVAAENLTLQATLDLIP